MIKYRQDLVIIIIFNLKFILNIECDTNKSFLNE